VHPLEFARFHANVWTTAEAAWLPQGAWQALYGPSDLEDGETLWCGVDIGGERSGTAVATVTDDGRVHADVWQGDDAVMRAAAHLRELHCRYRLAGVAFDPWRFQTEAQRLRTEGVPMVKVPQSAEGMTLASERLYASIMHAELRHDGDPVLAHHVAGATAKSTPRGWRLVRAERSKQIDAVIALAMANSLRVAPRAARPRSSGGCDAARVRRVRHAVDRGPLLELLEAAPTRLGLAAATGADPAARRIRLPDLRGDRGRSRPHPARMGRGKPRSRQPAQRVPRLPPGPASVTPGCSRPTALRSASS
jgi:hypothetical protein